jgi:hypothetical protein
MMEMNSKKASVRSRNRRLMPRTALISWREFSRPPLSAYSRAEDTHHGRSAYRFFIFRTSRGCEYLDLAICAVEPIPPPITPPAAGPFPAADRHSVLLAQPRGDESGLRG